MAVATNGASGASGAKAARTKAGEKQRMDVGRGLFGTGGTYRVVVEQCQRRTTEDTREALRSLRASGDGLVGFIR